jgi:hypothetical protein
MKQSTRHRKQIMHVRVAAFRLSPLRLLQEGRGEPRIGVECPGARR